MGELISLIGLRFIRQSSKEIVHRLLIFNSINHKSKPSYLQPTSFNNMNHEKVYKVIFASTIGTNVIYFVAKGETILAQGVPKNHPFMVLNKHLPPLHCPGKTMNKHKASILISQSHISQVSTT